MSTIYFTMWKIATKKKCEGVCCSYPSLSLHHVTTDASIKMKIIWSSAKSHFIGRQLKMRRQAKMTSPLRIKYWLQSVQLLCTFSIFVSDETRARNVTIYINIFHFSIQGYRVSVAVQKKRKKIELLLLLWFYCLQQILPSQSQLNNIQHRTRKRCNTRTNTLVQFYMDVAQFTIITIIIVCVQCV